jgi:hypothetical protein
MKKHRTGKMPFPPALKLLLRGYIIIVFILLMAHFNIITHTSLLIFLITIVSISMVFGIGCMLVMSGRPVRASNFDIPNTVLFFVKGMLVLYFISLLAEFAILPARITSALMIGIAGILVFAGVASYLFEVLDRSRPVPHRKTRQRPRTR